MVALELSALNELRDPKVIVRAGCLDGCGEEIRAAFQGRRIAIISDANVAPLYATRVIAACSPATVDLFTIPAGEASKTREQWSRLTDEMLDAGFGRDSAVVALGGGVVGDLAGFVAATYMRGIPFAQLPTSLLAMIDASVGGKTGVDTRAGKNLVGAFHNPALVLVDPAALATLPPAHMRNGLAEAIKHGVIGSPDFFEWLRENVAALLQPGGPPAGLADVFVRRNIIMKLGIVKLDERENGIRKTLNFGHTIGHAVESLSGYTLLHGECVAIGMVVESRIAARLGIADASLTSTVAQLIRACGLPTAVPESIAADAVLSATRSDKKARAGDVEYALPMRLGKMAGANQGFGIPVADSIVLEALGQSHSTL